VLEITLDSGAVVYDALFLALAEEAGTFVITADYKLLQALRSMAHTSLMHYLAGVSRLVSGTGGGVRAYCNRTATGLIRTGTQWTKRARQIIEIRINSAISGRTRTG
jgi:hypothetical protein